MRRAVSFALLGFLISSMPAVANDRGEEVVADAAMQALFGAWGEVSGKLQACGQERASARINDRVEALANILATRDTRTQIERQRLSGYEEKWVTANAYMPKANYSGYVSKFTIKEMLSKSLYGLQLQLERNSGFTGNCKAVANQKIDTEETFDEIGLAIHGQDWLSWGLANPPDVEAMLAQ